MSDITVCKYTKFQSSISYYLVKASHVYFYGLLVQDLDCVNPLNPELNPICYLLALLGAHHFLHVSRIRVKLLTLR